VTSLASVTDSCDEGPEGASPDRTAGTSRTPEDDASQRQALARYAILDTPPDLEFDELVDLARAATGAAAAVLGFQVGNRLWFKARSGIDADQIEPFTASADPCPDRPDDDPGPEGLVPVRQFTTPIDVGGRTFGFCAAAPITTSDGFVLGQLLILHESPLTLGGTERSALSAVARMALTRLELRRTLLSYHALINGVGHVVFQTAPDGRLLSVTPTWSQLTGFGMVRSVGRPLEDFVHGADRERVAAQLRQMRNSDGAAVFECRLERLLGNAVPVEVICRPMVDEVGRRRGLVGVIADISERHARAVEAQHAEKLEALGRLSAGLAHEINTPIQYVGDNARFLADSYESMLKLIIAYRLFAHDPAVKQIPTRSREAVEQAERDVDIDYLMEEIPPAIQQSLEGVERVATLVSAMKAFTHPGHESQAPADLNAALRSVVTIAYSQVKFIAELACEFQPLPEVTCAIGDLNQVFLNILLNAADAIEDKGSDRGTITISTEHVGENVVVRIADTGQGIPEDLRLRIFEPFFTTKQVGRGTGQGLALAGAVIERHAGTITVDSTVGVGSTFTVTLPIAGRPRDSESDQADPGLFRS
jgi:PAS domain S-box-containing protein